MNRKGFTLLELLMAAAIITALASVAVSSYRAKIADTYVEDGKNQARALATAVRLFELEYPSVTVREDGLNGSLGTIPDSCAPTETASPAMMVACGFLENRRWGNEHIVLAITNDGVCVKPGSLLTGKYKTMNPIFCVDPVTGESVGI